VDPDNSVNEFDGLWGIPTYFDSDEKGGRWCLFVDPDKPAKNSGGLQGMQTHFDSDERVQKLKGNFQWHLSTGGWDGSDTKVYNWMCFED
jgi:hypothetical protein